MDQKTTTPLNGYLKLLSNSFYLDSSKNEQLFLSILDNHGYVSSLVKFEPNFLKTLHDQKVAYIAFKKLNETKYFLILKDYIKQAKTDTLPKLIREQNFKV